MELNPDLYLVLRSRMIRAITPLPLECMVCTRPVHGAHRAVHGVHRASAWCSQGQCRVLTGPVHGAHMASTWCSQGQCMVSTGPVHGAHRASAWCTQGQCMVCTGPVHGAHRVSAWCPQGQLCFICYQYYDISPLQYVSLLCNFITTSFVC